MDRSSDTSEETCAESLDGPRVPPADGGKDAWLFLAGCFTIEMLLWGFPFSYGVLQHYYSTHEPFASNPSGISAIGTTVTGIMYFGSPLAFASLMKWPRLRRSCTMMGFVVLLLALFLSSFAQEVWQLILLQGVLYGVGGSMAYCPCILFMDEWFVRRKGLAFGIMWAGTGLGGLLIPFVLDWGLERFDFRIVVRGWIVVLIVLLGPLTYNLKPRLPVPDYDKFPKINVDFLRLRVFWVYQIPNILQGLGYFGPPLYLASYASRIGLPSIAGPLTVSIFNGTLVVGTIVLGAQTDRLHVTTVSLISALGASLSVFLLWGFAVSFPMLCTFSVVYGFFAGAYSSTWSHMITAVQKFDPSADTGLVFSMYAAGRGIGNLASGPLNQALVASQLWRGHGWLGYGTGYGALMVFVGVTALASGASWVGRRIGWV